MDACFGLLVLLVIVAAPIALYRWAVKYASPQAQEERESIRKEKERRRKTERLEKEWAEKYPPQKEKTDDERITEAEQRHKREVERIEKLDLDPRSKETMKRRAKRKLQWQVKQIYGYDLPQE